MRLALFYHSDVDSLASVTGRIGYAWDRFLGYVQGGSLWERDDYWATTLAWSGWTIGGGGEYALTKHLSAFVEYSYYDFGDPQIGLTPRVACLRRAFVDLEETTNIVRVGLNLRVDGFSHISQEIVLTVAVARGSIRRASCELRGRYDKSLDEQSGSGSRSQKRPRNQLGQTKELGCEEPALALSVMARSCICAEPRLRRDGAQ